LRIGRLSLNFRTKVVLLAVMLVTAIQLGTIVPVLHELRQRQQAEADDRVAQAGVLYDAYIANRTEQLTATIEALVRDYDFRSAVAEGDPPTIESTLRQHLSRSEHAYRLSAAVFDLEGGHVASVGGGRALWPGTAMERFALDPAAADEPVIAVAFIGGQPYHAVSFIVEAPTPVAWATLAVPIDGAIAAEISALSRLETTIVGFDASGKTVYATTLDVGRRAEALESVRLGENQTTVAAARAARRWITRLRPYHAATRDVYVAQQLPMMDVELAYAELRNSVAALAIAALLITMAAAVWLSSRVTQPIRRLVEAAERMADGNYSQAIPVRSQDEFAVLAQGFNSMQAAIASREQHIVHMAHHDSLSGLPTREIVVSEMRDAIAGAERLAVVNFVLHRFDELASSLGHSTADRQVQLVAGRLRDQLGEGQLLGHLNRQEFVFVLPGADQRAAETLVLGIQNLLRSGLAVGNANIAVQIRAGISLYPEHGVSASELLRCAGVARGNARHHQGAFGIYEPGQEERPLELIRIVGDFPRALRSGELWVEYQPKVACDSGQLVGAEALVRWQHPQLGRLPPDEFVAAIERAGGISQLTRWVLAEAARTLADWHANGLAICVSVNVSAEDLSDDNLPDYLEELCAGHGLEPDWLTLEITESAIMHDVASSLAVIARLRRQGFRIAIDDFGTGHSALAQLKRLPVDELKIDKSFVMNIADRRDEAVVRTAIELARQFGLATVAEGVENEDCRARLIHLGCDVAQGFLFSKSRPARDFAAWARTRERGEGADIVALVEVAETRRQASR
jgi:diguanylate cyclase (GGDEF)-like protein